MVKSCRLSIFNSQLSGGLAQLARAPALQAGGQRFDSVILHKRGVRKEGGFYYKEKKQ